MFETLLPDRSTLLLPFREGASNSAEPLRLGVVLDCGRASPWVEELVERLRQLPGIEVRLFPFTGRQPASATRPAWLTERLYSASRARFDPFGEVTVNGAESGAPDFVKAIKAAGCGLLIWLAGNKNPHLPLGGLAEYGILTVRLGDRDRSIPFWDEVANSQTTSTATIYWHEASFTQGRAVRKVETSTFQGLFFTLNAKEPLVATIRMLAGLCLEIHRGGRQFQERFRGLPEDPIEVPHPAAYPTNLEAGQFVLRKLAGNARLRCTARGKAARWFVAMRPNSGASIIDPGGELKEFREVPLPQGVEAMADPFLWETGGRTYLFFEEVASGSPKGRLGCVEVFEEGTCSEMKIILECPYHISYPCVAQAGGELFLLPESYEANCVELYRFSRFPEIVEPVARPVEGLALVDTTPVFLNDRWYFFTTTPPPFMESLLFWSERLDGTWHLHPYSPISCSVRNSRSAGNLFWKNGRLYRPTQDCSVRYGYAIQVNEVIRLTPAEFEERPVNWIPPAWSPGLLGTHTWNESSRLQVIDGIRLVNRGYPPSAG